MEEYRRLCRCEENMNMDIKETGVHVMSWMELAQDRDNGKAFANESCYTRHIVIYLFIYLLYICFILEFLSVFKQKCHH